MARSHTVFNAVFLRTSRFLACCGSLPSLHTPPTALPRARTNPVRSSSAAAFFASSAFTWLVPSFNP